MYKKCCDPENVSKNECGDGYYKKVIETDQLLCGEVFVPAHSKAGYDAGHRDADEVFYVVKGIATVDFPRTCETGVIQKGCYMMMPRSLPHIVSNHTDQDLLFIFVLSKKQSEYCIER